MKRTFKHLTRDDRLKIELYRKLGYSAKRIAQEIGCSVRTIYYELKRGVYDWLDGQTWKTEKRYSPDIAHEKYRANLKAKGAMLKIGNDYELAEYIENNPNYTPAKAFYDYSSECLKRKRWIAANSGSSQFGVTIDY